VLAYWHPRIVTSAHYIPCPWMFLYIHRQQYIPATDWFFLPLSAEPLPPKMFLYRSKSQGLMSGECEAYFTDLHCHHAREVFHVGGIMNGGWPVHYGSISTLQSWWRMLPHEILHIPGMSFRCALLLCGLLQSHWLTVVSSTCGTPFTHSTVPAIAKLLCHQPPEYLQWQRLNTMPLLHTSLTVYHSMSSGNLRVYPRAHCYS